MLLFTGSSLHYAVKCASKCNSRLFVTNQPTPAELLRLFWAMFMRSIAKNVTASKSGKLLVVRQCNCTNCSMGAAGLE